MTSVIPLSLHKELRGLDEPAFMKSWRDATERGDMTARQAHQREAERRSRSRAEQCEAEALDRLDFYWGRGKYAERQPGEHFVFDAPEPPKAA